MHPRRTDQKFTHAHQKYYVCVLIEEKVFVLDLLHLCICVVIQLYIVVSWLNLVAKFIYYSGQAVSLG
jgi:hypothetical protein